MGIIPARAGFTWSSTRPTRPSTDHPRSRGVYPCPESWVTPFPGSSPLARGLQIKERGGESFPRIIPARAGFTPTHKAWPTMAEDHPRSRGVYPPPLLRACDPVGSSPLARGLRLQRRVQARSRRIIPARAGFTALTISVVSAKEDHPRSRGVYWRRVAATGGQEGSSPLARGLPPIPRRRIPAIRIIPARAGFTRSRKRSICPRAWIIPARAGFTARPAAAGRPPKDHPRSRGVYVPRIHGSRWSVGSSPLARGLLHHLQRLPEGGGIIPARAGFTVR